VNKRLYFAIGIAVVFVAAVCFLDPFVLFILAFAPLCWIGLPAAIVGGILLLVSWRTGRSRRPAVFIISAVLGFAIFVGLAIPGNHFVYQRAEAAAKAYPARVEPLLEAYRQAHGAYPSSLDQLSDKPRVPRLLRTSYGYRSDGSSYTFCFHKPGGLIDTWNYDSTTKKWDLST
jgi:hypothetical protein